MADITLGSSASAVSARPELSIQDGTVTTTSLQVAQFFGKRHRDVMRAIKNLLSERPESDARNFAQTCVDTKIEVAANALGATRQDPAYRMNRDGFMLLAMGFAGKEALRWKLAYIAPSTPGGLQKHTQYKLRRQCLKSFSLATSNTCSALFYAVSRILQNQLS